MSLSAATNRRPRLDSLTSLRWFAAFAVFGHHFLVFVRVPEWAEGAMGFGYLGVPFFFVLSGFVLTWSWSKSVDAPTFYWRRFARIYPLHLITLLIAIPVFYRLAVPDGAWWIKPFDLGILLLSVALLQGWSRDPAIQFSGNPAAWTLTVEAFFYALHPPMMRLVRRLSRNGALIALAAVVLVSVAGQFVIVTWPQSPMALAPTPTLYLYQFVIGMLLGWACRQGLVPRIPLTVPVVLLGAFFLLIRLGPLSPVTAPLAAALNGYILVVTTIIFTLMIAAAAGRDMRGRGGWLTWRPLVALGEWSFAFYLIHATILYACLEVFGFQDHGRLVALGWFAATLVLATASAWALHAFVERPIERRLRGWQQRRREMRAAQRS